MRGSVLIGAAVAFCASMAGAANDVTVEIYGTVHSNQLRVSDFATVAPGDAMTISFGLDSTNYTDNMFFPTRGYHIDQSSFMVSFSGGQSMGMANPYGAGSPDFIIRNDDPAVDGFFLSDSPNFPQPIDLEQNGGLGPLSVSFLATYGDDPLDSLDIMGALGTWDFTGLTVFNLGINDGFFEGVLGADFSHMVISAAPVIPLPSAAGLGLVGLGVVASRRRR